MGESISAMWLSIGCGGGSMIGIWRFTGRVSGFPIAIFVRRPRVYQTQIRFARAVRLASRAPLPHARSLFHLSHRVSSLPELRPAAGCNSS